MRGDTASDAAGRGVDDMVPAHVVVPGSAGEVAAALHEAREAGAAVIPWGGGTHQTAGGRPTRYDVALNLHRLTSVRHHLPQDLTVTVEAGLTLGRLQQLLARHGQHLPLEVEDPDRATVGGLIGAGCVGPRRLGHGTVRDWLLWTEVAMPDGCLVRGGAPVVKSVAGYDTPKLHVGALGSLGVVTAACFRLAPLPAARQLVRVAVETPTDVARVLAAPTLARLRPTVLTVTRGPAAWGGAHRPDGYVVSCGFEGAQAAVEAATDRLDALLGEGRATLEVLADAGWDAALSALMVHRRWGTLRLRALTTSDRVPGLLGALEALSLPPTAVWAEAGNGVVRAAWGDVPSLPGSWWAEVRQVVEAAGGTWLVEAAPAAWKRHGLEVWGPERPAWALMRAIKHAWDPGGVLAPGRTPGG
ncbi:MAG: FAD-binding oxidoreductase [Candidatus Sericytochromatia bacterium]|nr:FAD-binding oxidoreductase [Candidatus Sericytochromatia bacterium]